MDWTFVGIVALLAIGVLMIINALISIGWFLGRASMIPCSTPLQSASDPKHARVGGGRQS